MVSEFSQRQDVNYTGSLDTSGPFESNEKDFLAEARPKQGHGGYVGSRFIAA